MVDLREHQERALRSLRNGAILWGGVGSGKSRVSAAYYVQNEAPKDVYVITTAKKRDSLDWDKEFVRFGIGRTKETTVAGVLRVDSWNNIGKYKDVKDAFFIFDEQRIVGSGKWAKNFLKIAKKNHWILLSATPGDTWMDYVPVFIANGFYRNRSEFIAEHVIYRPYMKFPVIDRFVGVNKLVKHKNAVLVEMPYERHTTRHDVVVPVDYDKPAFVDAVRRRWNPFEKRPMRGAAELYSVMRRIVGTHPSRLAAVKKLMEKHPRLIIFYNFNYELADLRTLVKAPESEADGLYSDPSRVVLAEWNGFKHEEVPRSERWIYLVQYAAGSEGWNCTSTDAMIFYTLTYSYKLWEQAHGRIDRMNTVCQDLWYYILMSDAWVEKVIRKALTSKKSFNEGKTVVKI